MKDNSPFSNPKLLTDSQVSDSYRLIMRCLKESTGLSHVQRAMVACWVIASRSLSSPKVQQFPILVLFGKLSTGKSSAQRVIAAFTDSKQVGCPLSTVPKIRELFIETREKVAILEEADSCQHDRDGRLEELLNCRFDRSTATGGLREQISEKNNKTETQKMETRNYEFFGGTVLHRRRPFNDPVLFGKSILIECRKNFEREYTKFDYSDESVMQGRSVLLSHTLVLPKISSIPRVAPRVFDNYLPVLSVASMVGDPRLTDHLTRLLHEETEKLSRSQTEEPDSQVMGAIVERVLAHVELSACGEVVGEPDWSPITTSDINNVIGQDATGRKMGSFNIGNIARSLGFRVDRYRHQERIHPTVLTFFRACDLAGICDDILLEATRKRFDHACTEKEKEKKKESPAYMHGGDDFCTVFSETKDLALSGKDRAAGEREPIQ